MPSKRSCHFHAESTIDASECLGSQSSTAFAIVLFATSSAGSPSRRARFVTSKRLFETRSISSTISLTLFAAGPQIQRDALASGNQVINAAAVGFGEIVHVNKISNTSAIPCGVVRPKYLETISLPSRGFDSQGMTWVRVCAIPRCGLRTSAPAALK